MISQRPTYPNGYLRLGKLFRLIGKLDDALRIYLKGLKKAIGRDTLELLKQIETLKRHQDRAIRPRNELNIFTLLPDELIHLIMSHLTTQDLKQVLKSSLHAIAPSKKAICLRSEVRLNTKFSSRAVKAIRDQLVPMKKLYCSSLSALEILLSQKKKWPNFKYLTFEKVALDENVLRRLNSFPSIVGVKFVRCHLPLSCTMSIIGNGLDLLRDIVFIFCEAVHNSIPLHPKAPFSFYWRPFVSLSESSNNYKRGSSPNCIYPPSDQNMIKILEFISNQLQHEETLFNNLMKDTPPGPCSRWENGHVGLWLDRRGRLSSFCYLKNEGTSQAARKIRDIFNCRNGISHVRHLVINDRIAFLGSKMPYLRSLYLVCPLTLKEVSNILEELHLINNCTPLKELGIFQLIGVIEPRRLLEIVTKSHCGRRLRLLCLPVLASLSKDALNGLLSDYSEIRVITEMSLASRLLNRHWRIPKEFFT